MSVIQTNRGDTCAICLGQFTSEASRFTHVGGEGHDGFHRDCLQSWVNQHSNCPFDRQYINPDSFLSRTDQIMQRLKPALKNIAYETTIGFAAIVIGVVVGVVVAEGAVGSGREGALTIGVAATVGNVVGAIAKQASNLLEVNRLARAKIALVGMYVAANAILIGLVSNSLPSTTAISEIAVISGIAAGVLSLFSPLQERLG